ncbi:protein D3-like [Planococcus citri]|uniref:protein D3-like n=1 Tax=Planococcus citri TaxID=170843 RepID=UPI0031F8B128
MLMFHCHFRRICIIFSILINFKTTCSDSDFIQRMTEAQIIPLITPRAPKHEIDIYYPIEGVFTKINAGDILDEYFVQKQPELTWSFREKTYYTLCMIGMTPNDLDVEFSGSSQAETSERPLMQQWEQWLVINIPGLHINEGNELAAYEPLPLPLENATDCYIFLIYEQTEKFEKFQDLMMTNTSGEDDYHSIELARYFAETQRQTDPWAGSFFLVNGPGPVPENISN